MIGYFFNKNLEYYEGMMEFGSIVVPQRPSANHYPVWNEGAFVEWQLNEAMTKQLSGKIPTSVFMSRVFVKPVELTTVADSQYIWQRFSAVCRVDPGVVQKLPLDGFVHGTAAEIQGLAFIYRISDSNLVDISVRDELGNIVSIPDGTIINEQEFQAILGLLTEYGVQ